MRPRRATAWTLSLPGGDVIGDQVQLLSTGLVLVSLAPGASLPLGPTDALSPLTVPSITGAAMDDYVGAGATFVTGFNTFTTTAFIGGGGNIANPQQTTAGGKICVIYTYEPAIPPQIAVTKSVSPTTIPATGGSAAYTIVVSNPGTVDTTISSLDDTMVTTFPDTCHVGTVLPAGGTCTISYAVLLPPAPAGSTAPNTVTVVGRAGGLTTDAALASATVTYLAASTNSSSSTTSSSNTTTTTTTTASSSTTTSSEDLPATGADSVPALWLGGGLVGFGLLLVLFGRRRRA